MHAYLGCEQARFEFCLCCRDCNWEASSTLEFQCLTFIYEVVEMYNYDMALQRFARRYLFTCSVPFLFLILLLLLYSSRLSL